MKKATTLSVLNQKGGVGKTTTTLNFSFALSLCNKKILLIDADPQGHLGNSLGVQQQQSGLDEVLLTGDSIAAHKQTIRTGIDILLAGQRLGEMETRTEGGISRGYRLRDAVNLLLTDHHYDYILIDCPPSAGLLGMNAILASDEIMIPVTGDYLALEGLSRLVQVLAKIEQKMNRTTRKWFVLTRFYHRRKLASEIKTKLIQYFPGQVLKTAIRESVALAESPGFGQSIFEYQPRSNGSLDYKSLADDYLGNNTCE